MTDPTGSTGYTYDANSRLTSVAAPQGTVGYTYDAAGNRASMSIPVRGSIAYTYDAANQLTKLTDWAGQSFTFTYASDGMPASIARPNGVATTYGYDGVDRLTSVHHDGPSGAIAHFDYTLDANGNRTSVASAAGTESYTLDVLNRLTGVSYPNGDAAAYTYDAAGNRLSSKLNGTTTNNTYDSAGHLTSSGGTNFTYDAAGNTTTAGTSSFSWDWAGRLGSATVGGTTSTYAYDGDSTRVGATTGATTTNYLWDRAAALPLLIDDGTQGYVHTDQGILEQRGGTSSYPLSDALGSVRSLASSAASVVGTANYDAFGSVRSHTGLSSIFGFTGQQTDPTNLSYLRARYYNPTLGRFFSPDSIQPNAPGTQGNDLYAYVANNPTARVDPSGQQAIVDLVAGLGRTVRAIPGASALGALLARALLAVRMAFEIAAKGCVARIFLCLETIEGGYVLAKVTEELIGSRPRPEPVTSPIANSGAPIPGVDEPMQPASSVDDAARQCLRSSHLSSLVFTGPQNPCSIQGISIYFSGTEIAPTTEHIRAAILDNRPALLHRRDVSTISRPHDLRSNCSGITAMEWCDEYPFFSAVENSTVQLSYAAVPESDQSVAYPDSQANSLRGFYGKSGCDVSKNSGAFVVIPQNYIRTFYVCSDGRVFRWQ